MCPCCKEHDGKADKVAGKSGRGLTGSGALQVRARNR